MGRGRDGTSTSRSYDSSDGKVTLSVYEGRHCKRRKRLGKLWLGDIYFVSEGGRGRGQVRGRQK